MKFLLLIVVVAVLLPGQLDALLWCYKCQGSGPDCADPFAKIPGYLFECVDETETFCQKTKTIKDEETIVVRKCARGCTDVNRKNDDGSRTINTCCTDAECNAATMTSVSMVVMVTSLLLTRLTRG